jgi:hypothetical protein
VCRYFFSPLLRGRANNQPFHFSKINTTRFYQAATPRANAPQESAARLRDAFNRAERNQRAPSNPSASSSSFLATGGGGGGRGGGDSRGGSDSMVVARMKRTGSAQSKVEVCSTLPFLPLPMSFVCWDSLYKSTFSPLRPRALLHSFFSLFYFYFNISIYLSPTLPPLPTRCLCTQPRSTQRQTRSLSRTTAITPVLASKPMLGERPGLLPTTTLALSQS